MKNGWAVFAILLGVLIIVGSIGVFEMSFGVFIEALLAFAFIADGINGVVKNRRSLSIGSFVFGIFLLIDAFKFFGLDLSFGQLFVIFIASIFISIGVAILRRRKAKL
ncbi:MAG: hypothetical protein J7J80_04225 [Thermotogae bacterium]|nr:hypothetical protein [Thermotogota bacterium]